MDISTARRISAVVTDQEVALVSAQADATDAELLQRETRCGLGSWQPAWLQKLASKKTFVLVYGLIGMAHFALGSYDVATISTKEKRFKMSSRTSGLISSGVDIAALFSSIVVAYLGRSGHKTRWVAWGTFLVCISCYMKLIPHWLYGPGEDALSLTTEFSSSFSPTSINGTKDGATMSLCGNHYSDSEDCSSSSSGDISAVILFTSSLVFGTGASTYYTLGISYMDDNSRKNKAPMMLAVWQCLRMLGPTFGYLLASYTLEMYVATDLTPTIDSKDPRWIGAWWLARQCKAVSGVNFSVNVASERVLFMYKGWHPFGLLTLLLAVIIAMFPRSLPRTAQRSVEAAAAKGISYSTQTKATQLSFADFGKTLKRLFTNKVLVCNCISSTCMLFGLIGHWVFTPKYMETQFHQTAATASFISGSVGLLCTAAGVLSSAAFISRFKPRARVLAGWNVIVELCDVIGFITLAFIGCETLLLQGNPQDDGTLDIHMECNQDCNCTSVLRYAPVCEPATRTTIFSACHAGCSSADWLQANTSNKSFSSCSCVEGGGPVIDGLCPVDCSQAFMLYLIIQCVQRFLSATGRAGNTLIHFRCVSPEDKPVSIGFSEVLFCGCGFIPGPIIFGILIDMSCLVWGYTCGETGNCLLYDVDKLRLYVNFPIVAALFIGTCWDVAVWYYVKDVELYDKDDKDEKLDDNMNPETENGNVLTSSHETDDENENTKSLNYIKDEI